jgi:hypothetical protein
MGSTAASTSSCGAALSSPSIGPLLLTAHAMKLTENKMTLRMSHLLSGVDGVPYKRRAILIGALSLGAIARAPKLSAVN